MEPNPIGDAAPRLADQAEPPVLSDREREILMLVATGAGNKDIAQQLVISPNTVKVHLRNIFGKIGVASRTEAALYAIRAGLVPNPAALGEVPSAEAADNETLATAIAGPAPSVVESAGGLRRRRLVWLVGAAVLIVLSLLVAAAIWRRPATVTVQPTSAPVTPIPRWSVRAPLPTVRSALAVTVFDNALYAIGGETASGVTGVVERYNAELDEWTSLAPKPLPVADASAAVAGGLIYVPGGRTQTGAVTNVLEVYDPRHDQWEQRAPMPVALSGYAAAVFEGKLYVFGGWTGEAYVALTYAYDPDRDEWSERTRMPTPRGLAGAAVAGERIYVIGGTDGEQDLSVNETYAPAEDVADGQPWRTLAPLPVGRSEVGVVSLAGTIHVVGGEMSDPSQPPLVYHLDTDTWQAIEAPPQALPGHAGVAAVGGKISVLAGDTHLEYQAVFLVLIPVVIP